MDLHSSDDEYFDTYSDLVENNVEPISCNIDQQKNFTESSLSGIDMNDQKLNNDPKTTLCNSVDSGQNNQGRDLTDLDKDFSRLQSDLTETNINAEIPKDESKLELSDSSDSESLVDELLNCENNDESKGNDNTDKVEIADSIKIEKSNEEVQFEERMRLEETLSEENLNELRQKSLIMKDEGNSNFKNQLYESAIELYTNAISTCPLMFKADHAIFYSNRGAALAKLDKYDDSIKDLSVALELKPDYLKALTRRAELREKTDKLTEALEDYRQILQLDPRNWAALHAEQTLPERIKIQQEKMKEEMLGQLKQLGNLVLKPFGLSTDNFKMVQDPATGSYSINFQNK